MRLVRARALTSSGALVARQGDAQRGSPKLDAAVAMWRELAISTACIGARQPRLGPRLRRKRQLARARRVRGESRASPELNDEAGATRASLVSHRCCRYGGHGRRAIALDLLDRAAGDCESSISPTTSSPTARHRAVIPSRREPATARVCGRFLSETSSRRASRCRGGDVGGRRGERAARSSLLLCGGALGIAGVSISDWLLERALERYLAPARVARGRVRRRRPRARARLRRHRRARAQRHRSSSNHCTPSPGKRLLVPGKFLRRAPARRAVGVGP